MVIYLPSAFYHAYQCIMSIYYNVPPLLPLSALESLNLAIPQLIIVKYAKLNLFN